MKYTSKNPSINKRLFVAVFTPSWLSALVCVFTGVAVSLWVVASTSLKSSSLRLDIITYKSVQDITFKAADSGILANPFISNLPLIAFWTIVGFVVYLFAINVFRAIGNTAELKNELDYVNVNRHDLMFSAFEALLVHLVVLVLWAGYIAFFVKHIIPYVFNLALVGAGQLHNPLVGGYALFAAVILALALHINVIFARLLFLRPRLFSSAGFVD